jgi:hypothetical protein
MTWAWWVDGNARHFAGPAPHTDFSSDALAMHLLQAAQQLKQPQPARATGRLRSAPTVRPLSFQPCRRHRPLATMNTTLPYETLFEIHRHGGADPIWLAILASGLVMLVLSLVARRRAKRKGEATAGPGLFVVASVVVLAAWAMALWDQQRLVAALDNGRAQVAQGPVLSHSVKATASYNGNSKRYDRRVWESFLVGDVAFGFDRKAGAAGFTNSAEPPVALADGDLLRVHFVEDVAGDYASRRILRLERMVRKPG